MNIGILGGTFDPIHAAHLIVAEEARERLELEEVVFVPAGEPWMKAGEPVSPAHHRLNMVRLAIMSNPFFRISSADVEREGPCYTVDTLVEMEADYGEDARFFFILGVDSLKEFHRWKDPERILQLAVLAVVTRPEMSSVDPTLLDELRRGAAERVVTLDGIHIGISATDLRHRFAQGRSTRYLVCEQVARYIAEHGLYKDAG